MRRPLAVSLPLVLLTVLRCRGGGGMRGECSIGGIVSKRPAEAVDVILVTIDTLRADSVGFAGNRDVSTPVLDRLAAAGRVYTNAHAHNVVTLPSHTNILT